MATPIRHPQRQQAAPPPPVPPPPPPVISTTIIDTPTQRLYALGIAALLQSIKLSDALQRSPSIALLLRWFCMDALYITLLPKLRIPRLTFSWSRKVVLLFACLCLNWLLFGNYSVPLSVPSLFPKLGSSSELEISTKEKSIRLQDIVRGDQHLLGKHTVRISPISTAHLNPSHLSFCLSPPHNTVLIPILFNNSQPSQIDYSIAPVGTKSKRQVLKLLAKDLRRTEALWKENAIIPVKHEDDDDDDPEIDTMDFSSQKLIKNSATSAPPKKSILTQRQQALYEIPLQRTQSFAHIQINKPGIIRLENIWSGSKGEVRIIPGSVVVVECPTAQFDEKITLAKKECSGVSKDLAIKARGVTPLKLKWHREINGKKEYFQIEGIEGAPETVNLPVTEDITIPLAVSLSALGKHHYVIDSLTDAVGNVVEPSTSVPSASPPLASRSVEVIHRSSVTFPACGSGRSLNLYKNGEAQLPIALGSTTGQAAGSFDTVKSIKVRYEPSSLAPTSGSAKGWVRDIVPQAVDGKIAPLVVKNPGSYTIVSVEGNQCSGDVMSPETCRVVELPLPSAEIDLKAIHECPGDVGTKASLLLHGTPPFTVFYTAQRDNGSPREQSRTISSARGEIVLQPESSGTYSYQFTSVSDKNYQRVPLKGNNLFIKQVVHPLASAEFVSGSGSGRRAGKHSLSSCSGNEVDVDVDIRGTAPWTLEFQIVGPQGSRIVTVPNLRQSRSRVKLAIPREIDAEGGSFQIDLVSVVDATECKRSLNVPGITVDVKRVKPTARFYSVDGNRQVTILEGETTSLPLRLTGDGPWTIGYRRVGPDQSDRLQTTTPNANGVIQIQQRGTYEIIDVQDLHCPGTILPTESVFQVDWVPKPTVQYAPTAGASARNDSIIRPAVCSGVEDYAELRLTGRPPYQITYSYSAETGSYERTRDVVTFNSVQDTARLQLRTSVAGHHQYWLMQIGDGAYPVRPNAQAQPHGGPIVRGQLLEQDVLIRPTAEFKLPTRISYCLNDALTPKTQYTDEGLVLLRGQPPFQLGISLKSVATNDIVREVIRVNSNEWRLNLPGYKLASVGPTLVTIESVKDSSPCSQAELEPLKSSIWIDVAETAAIVPFDRRDDFCEGEVISFQLEGTPPWTVRYSFNGKITTAISKTPKFSRVPVEPGVFKVVSVAHQSNMCQTDVDGIQMRVRPVPVAKVSQGRVEGSYLREGEQAKIVFELIGTPPFAFTYQRTALTPRGSKGAKVLETHTVSNVMTREYSVLSAQEGTWTVTFISDKYCRYPTTAPDSTVEEV